MEFPKILLASLLLVASCASEATIKNGDIETLFDKERTITPATTIAIDEPLANPFLVDIIDQIAIVQLGALSADFNFYVIDIKSGKILNKLFSVGRGRNEMMYPRYIGSSEGKIHIHDQFNSEINSIAIEELTTRSSDLRPIKTKPIEDPSTGFLEQEFIALSDGRFAAQVSDEDENNPKMVMAPIVDGQFTLGETFDIFGEGLDDPLKHNTYDGNLAATDDGKYMVFSTNSGIFLHFYDCSNSQAAPTMIKEHIAQLPKYDIQTFTRGENTITTVQADSKTLEGAYSISADNDNFYINTLNFDHTELNRLREEKITKYDSKVLVFNKKGEPKEKLILQDSKLMARVHHSSTTNSLYVLHYDDDGNDCFIQYKL